MKWTLSVAVVCILSGCGGEQNLPTALSSVAQTSGPAVFVEPHQAASLGAIASSAEHAQTHSTDSLNGAMLFAHRCAACHGQSAEKKALGHSQVIAGWESAKVVEALTGYQGGSYGGSMKAMMQAQVKSLNPHQIEALAVRISRL